MPLTIGKRSKENLLITGVGSGLGKAIFESLKIAQHFETVIGLGPNEILINENGSISQFLPQTGKLDDKADPLRKLNIVVSQFKRIDLAIHAGFPRIQREKSLNDIWNRSIQFTGELSAFDRIEKIYLMSSIDVFRGNDPAKIWDENDRPLIGEGELYGFLKWGQEEIIAKRGRSHLIFRLPSLLGKNARPNTLSKLIEGNPCYLSVDQNSRFNFITHDMVIDFLQASIDLDLGGVFHIASNDEIILADLVRYFFSTKEVNYGKYNYLCPKVSTQKMQKILPDLLTSNIRILKKFLT